MNDFDAYLELIILMGIVICTPFFWRACYTLGKLFIIKFFPPTTITLEIQKSDGEIELRKVDLSDYKELTKDLLLSTGKSVPNE